jgi:hypothetical protein
MPGRDEIRGNQRPLRRAAFAGDTPYAFTVSAAGNLAGKPLAGSAAGTEDHTEFTCSARPWFGVYLPLILNQ